MTGLAAQPITLPALVAAAVGGELVGNARGMVVHVALPGACFTPRGRLRKGHRPVCNQRARSLRRWPVDGRPLCSTCARRTGPIDARLLSPQVRAEVLSATLRTARDEPTWLACRRLALDLTQMRVDGMRVGELVANARDRLNAEPHVRRPLERYRMRRSPSTAPRVRGRRPDPTDLLFGGTA